MTVYTLPRRWGQIPTLACLLLVLIAVVRGLGNIQCGPRSLCGYGATCDNVTNRCVCLSGNGSLTKNKGIPFSTFYCLGEGVTGCGNQLCGYRAECNKAVGHCGCAFSYGVLTELTDTSPSLWYCVGACSPGSSSCPDNTTCTDPSRVKLYRCKCSAGATLSSTGQCLGRASTTTKTIERSQDVNIGSTASSDVMDRKQDDLNKRQDKGSGDSSQTLTTGLAVGMGVAILVGFVLAVALVWRIRFFKTRGKCECHCSVRQTAHSHGNASSTVELDRSYENVVSSSPPLERPSVDVPEHNSPNPYVNVPSETPYNDDTRGLYESANTPDTPETRPYSILCQT